MRAEILWKTRRSHNKALSFYFLEVFGLYYIGSFPCDPDYLKHYGIKGQKRGIRRFQNEDRTWTEEGKIRYGRKSLGLLKKLNDIMNSKWDYGVIHNGKRLTDTSKYNWGKNYRTTPVKELEKTKIGTCWDFTNYQHYVLKKMGIPDKSYMLLIPKSSDPNDLVTHTFTTFELGGKSYWIESAAWPKRGVHKIKSHGDVVSELMDMYGNPGLGYALYNYNPEGMDQGLTDKEFFNRATDDRNYVDGK